MLAYGLAVTAEIQTLTKVQLPPLILTFTAKGVAQPTHRSRVNPVPALSIADWYVVSIYGTDLPVCLMLQRLVA